MGVCLSSPNEGKIRWISTDGHRLAQVEKSVDEQVFGEGQEVIVPRKALTEVRRTADLFGKNVNISFDSRVMQFSGQEYTLTSSVTSTKIDTNETGLTNGSYVVAQSSVVPSGGSGATFSVVVSGNKITNVTIQNSGTGYKTGDIITLNTSGITGGSSAAKLKITSWN